MKIISGYIFKFSFLCFSILAFTANANEIDFQKEVQAKKEIEDCGNEFYNLSQIDTSEFYNVMYWKDLSDQCSKVTEQVSLLRLVMELESAQNCGKNKETSLIIIQQIKQRILAQLNSARMLILFNPKLKESDYYKNKKESLIQDIDYFKNKYFK